MRQLMATWNKKRDQEVGTDLGMSTVVDIGDDTQFEHDETDWENKGIRYAL
jgi:hypothetical protein